MSSRVRRIFVEKRKGFDLESSALCRELKVNLGVSGLRNVRILNRYDVEGLLDRDFEEAKERVFSEPPLDQLYEEELQLEPELKVFAVEYLPGQFDLRADSAAQCLQIISAKERPLVRSARVFLFEGTISDGEFERIKGYCINPVECRQADLEKPLSLKYITSSPSEVEVIKGFSDSSAEELQEWLSKLNLAMDLENLVFCRNYFRDTEKRDPTITELKVLDTYWSDHCRHTTFNTVIDRVQIEKDPMTGIIESAFKEYLQARDLSCCGENRQRALCLMDLATIRARVLKNEGLLEDLEESEEINASSIIVRAVVDEAEEEWLVMFKNETHNHPTEIEPFGGAATCLGGCIRDPLSGRSYAYQAMRITGSGDPRSAIENTLPGKLPQLKITTEAARGFSSYGNQVGLATGQVAELYDEGYIAKRMEIGFVIGAAPRQNVKRLKPEPGDLVLLLGGRTGRDGCGGATGSSREHSEESLLSQAAEVQKGNALEERKIQRFFRNQQVSSLIKKCNDFGAGGVSVAIGELADGLEINLDAIPKKYEGLDGTELAISESQERMAVVIDPADRQSFIDQALKENLECTPIAVVTAEKRLKMRWKEKLIVNLERMFLDSGGLEKHAAVEISAPRKENSFFTAVSGPALQKLPDIREAWLSNLEELNVCSQKGLVEMFDSTVGAGSVLMPFGGKYQDTPAEGMAARLPILRGETDLATLVTYGFDPALATWSPFHGALFAVIEAAAKNAVLGGRYGNIKLSLQEYFEKPGQEPERWGKPFAALLGAFLAQKELGIAAIGGKDSMSGTYNDLGVPPTLVAFAVNTAEAGLVVSQEFKQAGSRVIFLPLPRDRSEIPDFNLLKRNLALVNKLITNRVVLSAATVKRGGLAAAISKMCFGNRIGFSFGTPEELSGLPAVEELFSPDYGSIVLEIRGDADLNRLCSESPYVMLGSTVEEKHICLAGLEISLSEMLERWEKPLEPIFPTKTASQTEVLRIHAFNKRNSERPVHSHVRPRVFMPLFPGTNCEYDTARAFEKAGALVDSMVFKNITASQVAESISEMASRIGGAQIIAIPGGFSAGDEPDGTGKFIAAVFRNSLIEEAVMALLKNRDGLMLGICNGFQALIKLGLVPYGAYRIQNEHSPTLSFNDIKHHVSRISYTRVASVLSPWLAHLQPGDIHAVVISHGEGRFTADQGELESLFKKGQVATQYADLDGNPTCKSPFNPNGSFQAVEGLTSPCGRVFGKMGHPERIGKNIAVNVPGEKDQRIFEAGVTYFR